MGESYRMPDFEKAPEPGIGRKTGLAPSEGMIQVVDIYSRRSGSEFDSVVVRKFPVKRSSLAKALETTKFHAARKQLHEDPNYLGTIVQHEMFPALEAR